MAAARDTWTDGRLDDLNGRVDDLSSRVDAGFARVDDRLDGLHRTMILGFAGIAASVIASTVGAICAMLATQL